MIILEEHIVLKIFHQGDWATYDVIETHRGFDEVRFKILNQGDYLFTLVSAKKTDLAFELSDMDKLLATEIDAVLLSTIQSSLYAVFLREDPS